MDVRMPKVDSTIAARCMAVLYDKEDDKDYRLLCIHIDDACFSATIMQTEPPPPSSWLVFQKMKEGEKAAFVRDNPSYFKSGDAGVWLEKLSKVRAENHSNRMWMLEAVKILREKKDFERMKKVTDKLQEFKEEESFHSSHKDIPI